MIPIVTTVAGCATGGIAMYFAFRSRQLRHQERMAAIEKGIELPPAPSPGRDALLLRGLIWLCIGIAIVVFFVVTSITQSKRDVLPAAALGLIPAGIGIAYLIVYRVRGQQEQAAAGLRDLAASGRR